MTKKYQKELTDRQKKALPFFISCGSYEEGCRKAGVSKNALYCWLRDAAFKKELDHLLESVVAEAVLLLKSNITKASEALVTLLDLKGNPSILRAVSNDIIGHVHKFNESQEIERRLEALESRIETNT